MTTEAMTVLELAALQVEVTDRVALFTVDRPDVRGTDAFLGMRAPAFEGR